MFHQVLLKFKAGTVQHAGTGSWLQFNADFAAADVHTGDMTYTAVYGVSMTAELNSRFSRTFTDLIFMRLICAVKMEDRTSWRSFYYYSPVHLRGVPR